MLNSIFSSENSALFIAEIGLNHNGDLDVAKRMIGLAARAGAQMVKFQAFVPDQMNSIFTESLMSGGEEKEPGRKFLDFFSGFVFREEEYGELKAIAEENGLEFFASVFDIDSLRMMERLGVRLHKIASSEVTNHPLIEAVARTGKPALLSTGICTEEEIAAAVDLFRSRSEAELVLLHCVSLYPAQPEQVNLARIPALRARFGLETGFSDHTRGVQTAELAAAAGARIFEKHFTVDRIYECPDKVVSLTPEEFARMTEAVIRTIVMMGSGDLSSGEAESGTAKAARRSLFARKNIARGAVISETDLAGLRPGVGIPLSQRGTVLGKKARVDIKKDFLIRYEYLE